jgi:hypothetical protein
VERQATRVECADIDHAQTFLKLLATDEHGLHRSEILIRVIRVYLWLNLILDFLREADVAVDTFGGDAVAASADARRVSAAFRFFDLDVRYPTPVAVRCSH